MLGEFKDIYLEDESSKLAETEKMASTFKQNPGTGGDLKTFATVPLEKGVSSIPTLDIYASAFAVAPRSWQESFDKAHQLGKLSCTTPRELPYIMPLYPT